MVILDSMPSSVVYVRFGLRRDCDGECAVGVRAGAAGSPLHPSPLSAKSPDVVLPGTAGPVSRPVTRVCVCFLTPYSLCYVGMVGDMHVFVWDLGHPRWRGLDRSG